MAALSDEMRERIKNLLQEARAPLQEGERNFDANEARLSKNPDELEALLPMAMREEG